MANGVPIPDTLGNLWMWRIVAVVAHPHAKPVMNHVHQWHRESKWKRNTELIN